MIASRRLLRRTALAGGAAGLVAAGAALDRALDAGHLVSGFVAGVLLALATVATLAARTGRATVSAVAARPPPLPEELMAAYDWTATALDGSTFDLAQLRGDPFVLNVWSTLCPPCLAELPSLDRLHDAVKDDGVRVVCVATDVDAERVRRLVAEHGWRVPVLVLGDARLPPVFDSEWIPATWVAGADGRIVYQHAGAARWDHPRVISLLRGLSVKAAVSPGGPAVASPPRAVPDE